MANQNVTNIVFIGLGGQGVIRASDIVADVLFHAGWDVKKAEVHGMSQRGGVVTTDVRFGKQVLSPMVSRGEADYVVLLDGSVEDRALPLLRESGQIISAVDIEVERLPHKKCLNVALLGLLSLSLPATMGEWEAALRRNFRPALHEVNMHALHLGRRARRVA
jgi:indolepyruvate ferredoxin oxidoreductase, beta subunit